jgi:hypothetical protein
MMNDQPNALDEEVHALHEWLSPDTICKENITDNCPSWDTLVNELADLALNKLGRKNNNWLKIIPLVMHELAADVSHKVNSTYDEEIKVDGVPEWQTTMWDALKWPEEQVEDPLVDFNDGELSHDAVQKRMSQLYMDKELLDPFWEEDMRKHYANKKEEDKPVDEEPPHDPDLLM